MSDSYEGGVELRADDLFEGCVSIRSKFGMLHISLQLSNEVGSSSAQARLSPDEAREIAGALKRAAEAADNYVFLRSPAAVEMP